MIIHSEKIFLRPFKKEDATTILILRSDPRVLKYIHRTPYTTLKEAKDWVEHVIAGMKAQKFYNWAICKSDDSTMIGTICFWNFSKDGKTAELGYDLLPDYWAKGYMSEALMILLDYNLDHFHFTSIEAYTHKSNGPSLKMLRKFGFDIIGTSDTPDSVDHFILKRSYDHPPSYFIARQFGRALDRDDYQKARNLLSKEAIYHIGKETLKGPEAICNSYESNMIEGKKKLDKLEWGTAEISPLSKYEYLIHFTDFLEHKGKTFIHQCSQKVTVSKDHLIRKIEHQENKIEQERLESFYKSVGLK